MRRHPSTGKIAHGIAGAGGFVDDKQITPGGGRSGNLDWWGDRVIHHLDDRLCVSAPDGSSSQVFSPVVPTSFVRASEHGWAAFHDSTGVVTSWGLKLPKAVPLDMASDGALLVSDFYHPEQGKGISAYRPGSMTPLWRVPSASSSVRTYAQACIVDEKTAIWTEIVNGRQALKGYFNGVLSDGPRPPWDVVDFRGLMVNGALWVVYIRPGAADDNSENTVIAHPWDYKGLGFFVRGVSYGCEAWQEGDQLVLAWSIGPGETAGEIKRKPFDLSALEQIPSLPVPKPDTFGAHDGRMAPAGTAIRMADFVFAKTDFARKGGTAAKGHDMAQVTRPEGVYLVKFGEPESHEVWRLAPNGDVHHCYDGGKKVGMHFTLTLWARAEMPVGREFGYTAPTHEAHFFDVATKQRIETRGFEREMWLWRVYEAFDCGPDIGVRRVAVMVYDPTGGVYTPIEEMDPAKSRGMELFFFAEGYGWIGWQWHYAGRVHANGTPTFTDYTLGRELDGRRMENYFYRNGGKPVQPIPSGLATPITEEPPVSEKIPAPVAATIKAFFAAFPVIPGDGSEAWADANLRYLPNGRMAMLAQQLVFSHGADWGQKRRGPGSPTSAGSIALRAPGGMHVWDIQIGAGTGRPALNVDDAEYFWVTDQEWLPATAVNHLAAQKPRPGRAPWPAAVKHGVSGFDVAARLAQGDDSYYKLTAPLPLNVFVYTTIDHPATHRLGRTFVQGLAQTETLLKRLVADNRQAMFIMICGPHTANNGPKPTRAEMLSMVDQQVALFSRYAKAVLALVMGNELFQGFEPAELLEPSFQSEVEARIPLNFPFAIGQVSDAVVFGPGSCAMMHPDRGKGSAEALQVLADARDRDGRDVIGREPARIELGGSGQARGDINFVKDELANAKRLKLPYFLHLAAGRGCDVALMDSLQHEALALIKAEANAGSGGGGTTPPPSQGDPLLDAPLTYAFFITQWRAILVAAGEWYRRFAGGRAPGDTDLGHMVYRAFEEQHQPEPRWTTLRQAWMNDKPGGAPK